jgi:outer membrane protein OmpA-like peptidoglycan-associated protein
MESMVSPELLQRIAGKFGVNATAIKSGAASLAGHLVGGLSKKADDPRAMNKLAELVNESPDEPTDMHRMIDDESSPMRLRGNKLVALATDDREGLTAQLGRVSGLGGGAAAGLLGTIAGFVMAAFRKAGAGRHLDGASIGSFLHSEAGSVGERATDIGRAAKTTVASTIPGQAHAKHAHPRRWWWIALIPIAAIMIALFARGRERPRPAMPQRTPTSEARRSGQTMTMTYPTGSAEATLLESLRASTGPSGAWVPLDSVAFETGSSTVGESSMEQIGHLAKIMQTYPGAHLKIRGYADAGGENAEATATQSAARADGVRQALVDRGIDASRVEALAAQPESAVRHVEVQVTTR